MGWMFFCPDPCGGQVVPGGAAPAGGGECQRCGKVWASAQELVAAKGVTVHACTRGQRRQRCGVPGCDRPQAALCDEPVERKGVRGTCDASMCETHRTRVGPNRDRCPAHAKRAATP